MQLGGLKDIAFLGWSKSVYLAIECRNSWVNLFMREIPLFPVSETAWD